MSEIWAAISALSALVSALVVIGAAFYAALQVRELRSSRNLTLLLEFQKEYHSVQVRTIRSKLLDGDFGGPDEFDPSTLSRQEQIEFWRLFDQLQTLGVLVEKGLIDFHLVRACFHESPPAVWTMVKPFVANNRKDGSTEQGLYLEKLARRYATETQ